MVLWHEIHNSCFGIKGSKERIKGKGVGRVGLYYNDLRLLTASERRSKQESGSDQVGGFVRSHVLRVSFFDHLASQGE